MYFSRSFIASALLGLGAATTHMGEMPAGGLATSSTSALAASETPASAPAAQQSGSAGTVATHVVQVGGPNGSLTFSPENVKASVGDLVQFQFHPKVRTSNATPLAHHLTCPRTIPLSSLPSTTLACQSKT